MYTDLDLGKNLENTHSVNRHTNFSDMNTLKPNIYITAQLRVKLYRREYVVIVYTTLFVNIH